MSKKHRAKPTARDEPAQNRSLVWVADQNSWKSLECKGYVPLSQNPEVCTAVDTIARLIGSMTIHLMRNTTAGDVRVIDELAKKVDINPNQNLTRSEFVRWIVRTMMLDGDGNAVVYPKTRAGYLKDLIPIPAAYTAFVPDGEYGYKIMISGQEYKPDRLLHFRCNPGRFYPWLGEGYRLTLADVAQNLRQAAATEKGFMSSEYKPSLIIKVDALVDEFSSPEGRDKLLESYCRAGQAGEPWLIPAQQFDVQQVKPLTLSDLALADFVKLDKQTVASILGIPSFVLGVGDFSRDAWNSFINTTIMPMAQNIQQELTQKLLLSPDLYFRFNSWSLYSYSMTEMVEAGGQMVDRMALRRNEWRDWLGLPPDPDMDDLLALENYVPADRLGDQAKLNGGDGK
nr:MAG TPA_asm: portal protein [Caudoviricetes sp.]